MKETRLELFLRDPVLALCVRLVTGELHCRVEQGGVASSWHLAFREWGHEYVCVYMYIFIYVYISIYIYNEYTEYTT